MSRREEIKLADQDHLPNLQVTDFPVERQRFVDSDDEVSLRKLAIVPFKRKRTVLVCALLGLVLAILANLFMQPRYRATATIELNEKNRAG